MKLNTFILTFLAIGTSHIALAADDDGKFLFGDLTGTVAVTSEYSFRGLTQDDENPALQAGLTYTHAVTQATDAYLGVWGSNVDFNDGGKASLELDGLGGVIYKTGSWSFDTGFVYYTYPGADKSLNYDYVEAQEKISYTSPWATVSGAVHYSPDYFAGSGRTFYYETNATIPLPKNFSLTGHLGRSQIADNTAFILPDYTDWGAGVTYNYKGFDFGVNYVDTSINDTTCARGCEARAIFSITKNF